MIRHIEFTINYDLTCWGEKEDFEIDTKEEMTESLVDYVTTYTDDLLPHMTITKVWYEDDEE